jgi:hypothetical protein
MAWAPSHPIVKAPANGTEVQGLLRFHGEWGDLGVV